MSSISSRSGSWTRCTYTFLSVLILKRSLMAATVTDALVVYISVAFSPSAWNASSIVKLLVTMSILCLRGMVPPFTSAFTGYLSAHSLIWCPRLCAVYLSRSSMTMTFSPLYPSNHFDYSSVKGSSPYFSRAIWRALRDFPVPGGPYIHRPLVPWASAGLSVANLNRLSALSILSYWRTMASLPSIWTKSWRASPSRSLFPRMRVLESLADMY